MSNFVANNKGAKMKFGATLKLALCLSTASVALTAFQAHAGAVQEENGKVIYDQAYFSKYNAVTLADMIRAVPGGTPIIDTLIRQATRGQATRGFGASGTQFLINGKRISSKASDMAKNLKRIQASQVDHIELIRGNAEGLDIRNEGILINVILKEGAENMSSTFVEARVDWSKGIAPRPNGTISHNGKSGDINYGISYVLSEIPIVRTTDEEVLDGGDTLSQFRPLKTKQDKTEHIFNGNLGFDFGDNGLLRLNGLFLTNTYDENMKEDHLDFLGNDQYALAASENTLFDYNEDKWEIGGDYERSLGVLGNFKGLFVINNSHKKEDIVQYHTEGDTTETNFDSRADFTTKEQIIRTAITTDLFDSQSLEWGGEGAFNTLDKTQIFVGESEDIGVVKEDRYEIFATHNYNITPEASLQTSLTNEFSRIAQDREGTTNKRKYSYLKPRIELRYNVTDLDQLRFTSERKVSQLDLNNFIAKRNVADDSIDYGNPDLVPEKTWTHSIGYEKRLEKDAGSFELRLFYEDVKDHIDRIRIGDFADYNSGVGNIGDATKYGYEIKGNKRLGFIGLQNAMVTASFINTHSEVIDPFSGNERPTREPLGKFWRIDYEHVLPEYNAKYGLNLHHQVQNYRYDINLYERLKALYHLTYYIEYTYEKVKATLHVSHILGDNKRAWKTFYVNDQSSGIIERLDRQKNGKSPDIYFSLQTTF